MRSPITPIVDELALLAQRLDGKDKRTVFGASLDILALYGALREALPLVEFLATEMSGERGSRRAYRRVVSALTRVEAVIRR